MRTFSTFKTLFFMSAIAICVGCSGGSGADGTGSNPATVVADGQAACHAQCQRLYDYKTANPAECTSPWVSLDVCIYNRCDQFSSGKTQACESAFAAFYVCASNSATSISCASPPHEPVIRNGCSNETNAMNSACH
jgi:hypothetical protein